MFKAYNKQVAVRGGVLGAQALMAITVLPATLLLGYWSAIDPILCVALVAAAVVGEATEVKLASGVRLDSTTAIGLVALALWGAGPAFLVMISPIVLWSLLGPLRSSGRGLRGQLRGRWRRFWRPGNVSNCSSYGWSLIAADAWLSLVHLPLTTPAGVVVALLPASVIASTSQFALGPCLHETTWNHYSIKDILEPTRKAAAIDFLMLLAGSIIAMLTLILGLPALSLLAVVVLLPPLIPAAAHPRTIGTHAQAADLYTEALACTLGLTRRERRMLRAVLNHYRQIQQSGLLHEIETTRTLDPAALKALLRRYPPAYAAWTISERWDGYGPCGLRHTQIPPRARIIAVAEQLAKLTATDGDGLDLTAAAHHIALQAGQQFDPAVASAAEVIAKREHRFNHAIAEYQGATVLRPSLHRLKLLRTAVLGQETDLVPPGGWC